MLCHPIRNRALILVSVVLLSRVLAVVEASTPRPLSPSVSPSPPPSPAEAEEAGGAEEVGATCANLHASTEKVAQRECEESGPGCTVKSSTTAGGSSNAAPAVLLSMAMDQHHQQHRNRRQSVRGGKWECCCPSVSHSARPARRRRGATVFPFPSSSGTPPRPILPLPTPPPDDLVDEIWAIGDIHGDYDAAVDALRHTGLVEIGQEPGEGREEILFQSSNFAPPEYDKRAYVRWRTLEELTAPAGKKFAVIVMGDVVQYGTMDDACVKLVGMLRKLSISQPHIRMELLLGNHEDMNIRSTFEYVASGNLNSPFDSGDMLCFRNPEAGCPHDWVEQREQLVKSWNDDEKYALKRMKVWTRVGLRIPSPPSSTTVLTAADDAGEGGGAAGGGVRGAAVDPEVVAATPAATPAATSTQDPRAISVASAPVPAAASAPAKGAPARADNRSPVKTFLFVHAGIMAGTSSMVEERDKDVWRSSINKAEELATRGEKEFGEQEMVEHPNLPIWSRLAINDRMKAPGYWDEYEDYYGTNFKAHLDPDRCKELIDTLAIMNAQVMVVGHTPSITMRGGVCTPVPGSSADGRGYSYPDGYSGRIRGKVTMVPLKDARVSQSVDKLLAPLVMDGSDVAPPAGPARLIGIDTLLSRGKRGRDYGANGFAPAILRINERGMVSVFLTDPDQLVKGPAV